MLAWSSVLSSRLESRSGSLSRQVRCCLLAYCLISNYLNLKSYLFLNIAQRLRRRRLFLQERRQTATRIGCPGKHLCHGGLNLPEIRPILLQELVQLQCRCRARRVLAPCAVEPAGSWGKGPRRIWCRKAGKPERSRQSIIRRHQCHAASSIVWTERSSSAGHRRGPRGSDDGRDGDGRPNGRRGLPADGRDGR